MKTNFSSEEVMQMADYSDWDLKEVETVLTNTFPNAKEMTIVLIEFDDIIVIVDGIKYTIDVTGEILDMENA